MADLFDAFNELGRIPAMGHRRPDLTTEPVFFYRLYSYLIIYKKESKPIVVLAVLHGKRNIKRLLDRRL